MIGICIGLFLLISGGDAKHKKHGHINDIYDLNDLLDDDYYSFSNNNDYYQEYDNSYSQALWQTLLDKYDALKNYYYRSAWMQNIGGSYYDDDNADDALIISDLEEENGVSFGVDMDLSGAGAANVASMVRVIIFATEGYDKSRPGDLDLDQVAHELNNRTLKAKWKGVVKEVVASCNSLKHPVDAAGYKKRTGTNKAEMSAAKMYTKTSGVSFAGSKYWRTKAVIDTACNNYATDTSHSRADREAIGGIPHDIQKYLKLLKAACLHDERWAVLEALFTEQKEWATTQIRALNADERKRKTERKWKTLSREQYEIKRQMYMSMKDDTHLLLYIGMSGLTFSDDDLRRHRVSTDAGDVWHGPTSASLDIRVSKRFACWRSVSRTPVVFWVKIPMNDLEDLKERYPTFGSIDVRPISPYPEAEVLLWDIPREFISIWGYFKEDGDLFYGNGWFHQERDDYFDQYTQNKLNWNEWGKTGNCAFKDDTELIHCVG